MLFGRNDKGVPLELTINTRMFEEKRTDLKEALRNAIRDHQAEPIESAMSVNEYTTKQDRARTTLATYPVGDREWADLFENRIWHMSSSHWRDKKETYIMDRQQVSKEERFVRWRVTERAGSYFNSLVEKRRAGELPKGKPIIVVELSADDCKHADLWMRIFKETEDEWAEEHGEELDFFKNMTFMLGEISGEIVKQAVTARDTPFLYEHRDKLKFIDAKVDFNKMGEVFLGLDIGPTERVSSGVFEQLCVLFESRQHPYLDRSTLERMNRTCLSVQSLIAHLVAMADAYDIDDDLRRALVSFDQTLFSFYQITEDRFFKALGIEDRDIRRLLGEASLGMINYAHNLTPAALISKRSGKIYKRMAKAYLAPSLNKDFIDDPANKDEFHSLGVREPEDIIELIEDEERYAKLSPELTLKIWEGVRIEYGCYEDDDPSAQLEEFLHSIEAEDVTMPMNVTFDLSVVAILWHMLLNNFGRLEIVDTIMEHTDEFTDRFWQLRKYGTSLAIWIDYLYFQRTGFDRFPPHGYQVATTTVPVRSIPGTSKDDNGTFLSFEWKPSQQLLELAKIVEGIVGTRLNPRQTISMVTMGHMDEALSGVSNSRSSNAGSGTESGDRERFSRSQPLIAEEVGENRFTLLTIDQAA
ncbi:MAG: hypothetical protein HQ572_00495 [Candidatus Omnitrophica bacterium]|nr:hypothetical protein [Candidatus Omnitrophota bacterium]